MPFLIYRNLHYIRIIKKIGEYHTDFKHNVHRKLCEILHIIPDFEKHKDYLNKLFWSRGNCNHIQPLMPFRPHVQSAIDALEFHFDHITGRLTTRKNMKPTGLSTSSSSSSQIPRDILAHSYKLRQGLQIPPSCVSWQGVLQEHGRNTLHLPEAL